MVKTAQCTKGVQVIINDWESKSDIEFGISPKNMLGMYFTDGSYSIGEPLPLFIPGTILTVLGPPRRYNNGGNQVKFTIEGDPCIYASWWCRFKYKVNKI
jgi:hypothetical protein